MNGLDARLGQLREEIYERLGYKWSDDTEEEITGFDPCAWFNLQTEINLCIEMDWPEKKSIASEKIEALCKGISPTVLNACYAYFFLQEADAGKSFDAIISAYRCLLGGSAEVAQAEMQSYMQSYMQVRRRKGVSNWYTKPLIDLINKIIKNNKGIADKDIYNKLNDCDSWSGLFTSVVRDKHQRTELLGEFTRNGRVIKKRKEIDSVYLTTFLGNHSKQITRRKKRLKRNNR